MVQAALKNNPKKSGGARPGAGRPKGVGNRATQAARDAIGKFVDGNAHRLQEWLDAIARGVERPRAPDADPDAPVEYIVKPDPKTAYDLFQSVIEYHVPKLARTEHAVDPNGKTAALVMVQFAEAPKS